MKSLIILFLIFIFAGCQANAPKIKYDTVKIDIKKEGCFYSHVDDRKIVCFLINEYEFIETKDKISTVRIRNENFKLKLSEGTLGKLKVFKLIGTAIQKSKEKREKENE